MSNRGGDVYGGNYPKAKRLAFARSGGICQFCGLQEAEEGHHWAFYDYPSGEDVQGHDLTALCTPCHELATTMRDWMERKGTDINFLREELEQCNSFIAKREAISYWIYPEGADEMYSRLLSEKRYLDPDEPHNRPYAYSSTVESHAVSEDEGSSHGCLIVLFVIIGLGILTYLMNS